MKTKLLMLVAIVFVCTGFGYASTDDPMKNYYGADLTQFPPDVRDWIVNRAFTKEKMEKPFMVDSKLRVWWSSDNNAVQTEATYTVAEGYKGAGTVEKWGNVEYSGGSDIFNTYGEYAKYHTLRFKWELQKRAYELLETDPAFAEIIRFAKLLCDEIEYDWDNFSSYAGKPVRRTPNKKYYVCEGYANEVMDMALELNAYDPSRNGALQGTRGMYSG